MKKRKFEFVCVCGETKFVEYKGRKCKCGKVLIKHGKQTKQETQKKQGVNC